MHTTRLVMHCQREQLTQHSQIVCGQNEEWHCQLLVIMIGFDILAGIPASILKLISRKYIKTYFYA